MADEERQEGQEEAQEEAPKKKGKGKLIIILVLVVVLAGGGFVGYKMMAKTPPPEEDPVKEQVKKEEVPVLFPMEPFVVNLADKGRYLKLNLQLELVDKQFEELAQQKVPPIRDAIITLISSKSAKSISTPEGKFQLKDEILMRVNAAVGQDIFKNVYFTEFVMQ